MRCGEMEGNKEDFQGFMRVLRASKIMCSSTRRRLLTKSPILGRTQRLGFGWPVGHQNLGQAHPSANIDFDFDGTQVASQQTF